MKESLIEFSKVTKYYGKRLVLDNISFKIGEKSIITLVGPNGAGKTTVSKLIVDIEKPTSGSIYKSPNITLGYVPQKININTNLPIKVLSLIEMLTNHRNYDSEILKFAQVENVKNHDISELSGGQLRRVFLTACLLNKANLIILDEPTKELDITGQKDLYTLIQNLRREFGITIFIISHDLHTVVKESDYVLCLNKHLCCYGKPYADNVLESIGFYKHLHNHTHS